MMRPGCVPWPDEVAETYRARGYWLGRPLGDHLWERADRFGDRVAVVDGEVRLSYLELMERSDALAARLADLGLASGDSLLLQLTNRWELVALTIAGWRLGVAPIMAMPQHRHHELSHLAAQAEVTAIAVPDVHRGFDHQALAAEVAEATPSVRAVLVLADDQAPGQLRATERQRRSGHGRRAWPGNATARHHDLGGLLAPSSDPAADRRRLDAAPPPSGDVAVFLLSGGTTGLPKLITRTHDDYEYNARRSGEVSRLGPGTVYLITLPAGHNFPLACPGILGTLLVGGRVVMLASPDPDRAFAAIEAERVTVTGAVPAVAQRWLDAAPGSDHDLSSLEVLQVGGARLATEVARRVGPTLGATLQQVFGMAEGLLNYTDLDDPDEVIVETQGRPISPDDEVRIVDPADEPVAEGEMGALLTRGPYTPRGYFRAEDHNRRAFTPDGWYRTGDVVRRHPSGNLVVEGRDKDLINRGGEKISAEEVENLTYALPAVAQVAAVAMPDPDLGERVCVFVVLRPGTGLDLDELRAALTDAGVAAYKQPERLEVVEGLPLTNVGKVDKAALRDRLAGEAQ